MDDLPTRTGPSPHRQDPAPIAHQQAPSITPRRAGSSVTDNAAAPSAPGVPSVPGAESAALVSRMAARISAKVASVITGKPEAIEASVTTLIAGGHLLIEDVPGVGKTTLATVLARSIDADVTRIQFTSDMLPTDVTGVSVFDQGTQEFRFHPGPLFTNFVIGDEVNRATPKTQSALLEAMGENQVTVDGHTLALPDLFMVVATQNPQDMEGTFPLPEAQRDRFMTRISLGYPDADAELAMLSARGGSDPLHRVRAVTTTEDAVRARAIAGCIHMDPAVERYLIAIVAATRDHPGLALGASPRASLHLARMARARAAMSGRPFVSPDDVARLASMVLAHRLVPRGRSAAGADALHTAQRIVSDILTQVPVPGRS